MFASAISATEVYCGNYPDVSFGSSTIVQYGAGTGTISASATILKNKSTVAYSAVAGSATEAELRVTKTATTFSDISTETATCNGAISNWANYFQTSADKGLNQVTSICRASRDSDTLKFSCRNGFGGARRRRRVAWSDCSQSAPASSDTATSESECISAHTETLQSTTCTKLAQPGNSVPRSSDSSPFTVAACLLGALAYILSQERMMN